MRRILTLILILSFVAMAGIDAQPTTSKPNIVLIITDDVGYGDFGCTARLTSRLRHLDALAKAGTRFTQFYANASSCSPTRAGLISGRYQQRYVVERPLGAVSSRDGKLGLPATGRSLPQLLKNHGYATALLGKWHLGYEPQIQPPCARLRFVLRLQERLYRLLPAHRQRRNQ